MIRPSVLRVSPLSDTHAPDVERIQQECYGAEHLETPQSLSAKWRASPATCFAAEDDRQVVAYLIAVPVRYPELPAWNAPAIEIPRGAETLYLHDLAVSRQARGSGAGRALVRAALDHAMRAGYGQACLVAVQDSAAVWQAYGFQATSPPTPEASNKLATFGPGARLMTARW